MLNKVSAIAALTLVLLVGGVSITGFTTSKKVVETESTATVSSPQSVPQAGAPNVNSYKVTSLDVDPAQIIVFNTPVVYETAEAAINELKRIENSGASQAFLVLDSPGGSVVDGAKLGAYMKHTKLKVNTVCDGICASMAAHLFQIGKTRYMTDKSILMFHPASGGLMGTLEEMLSQLTMIKLYVDRMDAEAAARAGIDYRQFKERVLVEYWLESVDAVNVKHADKIAFISYSRESSEVFNMDNHIKKQNLDIPENLKKPGFIFESIKLSDKPVKKVK